MSKEDKNTFNFLCARFLGYELVSPFMRKNPNNWAHSYWEHKDKVNTHTFKKVLGRDEDLLFHSDWNWIMKVVEAIEKIVFDENNSFNVTIGSTNYCVIQDSKGEVFETIQEYRESKKQTVVQAISQFLIWYNDHKIN